MRVPFENLITIDEMPKNGGALPNKLWPFFWYFLRQDLQPWVWAIIVCVTYAVADASLPYFVKLAVASLENGFNQPQFLWALSTLVGLTLIFIPLTSIVSDLLLARIQNAFANKVRYQLSAHLLQQPLDYFEKDYAGRISSKVMETPSAMRAFANMVVRDVSWAGITMFMSIGLMLTAHWAFATVFVIFMVCYFVMFKLTNLRLMQQSTTAYDKHSYVRGQAVDMITNILSVKLFSRRQYELQQLNKYMQGSQYEFQKLGILSGLQALVLEILMGILYAACAYISYTGYKAGWISMADIAMVWTVLLRCRGAFFWLLHLSQHLFENLGQIAEGMQALVIPHTVTDKPNAPALILKSTDIQLQHVGFAYHTRPVFNDFNLVIPAGQKVGLLGASGAGKSTLTKILLRLYDVQTGHILVGGTDITQVTQDSLREHIGVIPQMPELLHRSIRDNITYGKIGADMAAVERAARAAEAHEFIVQLKDHKGNTGYDALVGERGVKLSGGQRQRIALARAFLKDAPILLLDEATSALDTASERAVQAGLATLMQNRTVIAIAHRLSTIAHLDRLIVLDNGKIIEDGTHAALLAQNGVYAKLWAMQTGDFIGLPPNPVAEHLMTVPNQPHNDADLTDDDAMHPTSTGHCGHDHG